MPRFPIKSSQIVNGVASVTGPDYHHMVNVLRLRPGAGVTLFEDNGLEHSGKITEITKKEVRVKITASIKIDRESRLDLALLQGIIKSAKMDLIIEKATELGVQTIVPLITQRSRTNIGKPDRWQRIANESLKQCGRVRAPKIYDPQGLASAVKYWQDRDLKLIFYEQSHDKLSDYLNNVLHPIDTITLIVGPEGGFAEEEVKLAENYQYTSLGLGHGILRSETASISVLSILQFRFGDI